MVTLNGKKIKAIELTLKQNNIRFNYKNTKKLNLNLTNLS